MYKYAIGLAVSLFPFVHMGHSRESDSYVCVVERSTGFSFDPATNHWITSVYRGGEQYVLRQGRAEEMVTREFIQAKWVVQQIGVDDPFATCATDFDEFGYLDCGRYLNFYFNRNTSRFTISCKLGFVIDPNGAKEGYLEPFVAIGRCTQIN